MSTLLKMPVQTEEKLLELRNLCEEHPIYIPLPVAASFLGAHPDGLRCSLEQGKCPFGLSWQKDIRGNKAFKIPTATFFLWYTQGYGYRDRGSA